ncbi:DUF2970 domain-containing protein [Candidatus Spongiihabitans sp.]|uniref:DUF2970 domain-containing protein n=1 Tax=Candidatus Spongiihabitans sp. TaxID=3101308 RepID=UPI003C7CABC2
MSTHNQPPEDPNLKKQAVTFFTIIQSVFSSFIGIQNNANRKRDFESGKFWHFFAAGIIFVVIFVVALWLGAKYLIATAA